MQFKIYITCFLLAITICLTIATLLRFVTIKFSNQLKYSKLSLRPYKLIFVALCFQCIEQVFLCIEPDQPSYSSLFTLNESCKLAATFACFFEFAKSDCALYRFVAFQKSITIYELDVQR